VTASEDDLALRAQARETVHFVRFSRPEAAIAASRRFASAPDLPPPSGAAITFS
jgi:hypothetical protein